MGLWELMSWIVIVLRGRSGNGLFGVFLEVPPSGQHHVAGFAVHFAITISIVAVIILVKQVVNV